MMVYLRLSLNGQCLFNKQEYILFEMEHTIFLE